MRSQGTAYTPSRNMRSPRHALLGFRQVVRQMQHSQVSTRTWLLECRGDPWCLTFQSHTRA